MEVEGLKPAHILKKVHCRGRWQQSPPPPRAHVTEQSRNLTR